jgi:Zn-dependent M28 family amino/carboxypeptidase
MTRNAAIAIRMLFTLAFVAAIALLLWILLRAPGDSFSGGREPLGPGEQIVARALHAHVNALAGGERNFAHPAALELAARYIEASFEKSGYTPSSQLFSRGTEQVRNIEAEVPGGALAGEIVLVGAHYDSVIGSPGANDNGSGVAAMLELARLLSEAEPSRTLRFVAFVDEEPPFYRSEQMGSRHYARRSRERGENIVAMISLETIGYYSGQPGSQHYPFPLGYFYPSTGNFIAFVSDLGSRSLLHEAVAGFRRHAAFPSEALAAPAFIPGVDWSDHWSFRQEGYPALMVTDTALYRYPYYHSAQDTPDKLDYDSMARVVTGLQAMLRELTIR